MQTVAREDLPVNRDSAFIALIIVTGIFVIIIVVVDIRRNVAGCCGTHY